jgi:hypothetical protein
MTNGRKIKESAISLGADLCGIAGLLMDFAERLALTNKYGSIRLDAYTGNPQAIRLYDGRGYVRTGQVFFPRRTLPFFCYEKVIGASR